METIVPCAQLDTCLFHCTVFIYMEMKWCALQHSLLVSLVQQEQWTENKNQLCAEKFCRRGSRGIVPCQKGKWAGLKRCPVSQLRFSSLGRSEELFQNGTLRLCCHDPSGHHFKWNQNHIFNSRCNKMIVCLIWQYYRCRQMRKGSFFKELQLRLRFPVPNWIQRDSCRAQCHWEVKAGRIRKGQERGSRLQGNKGKPIPLGMILTLETQESADSGSMGSSGGRKQEGTRAGYCTKESVPRSIKTTPQSCRRSCYLFRCLSLNVVPPHPVSAECWSHTHRTELRSRWCKLTSRDGECFTDTQRKTLS